MNRVFSILFFGFAFFTTACTTTAQTLRTVALTGQQAPGTPGGVSFDTFVIPTGSFSSAPSINVNGQTAFWGIVAGPGIDGSNQEGVWSEGAGSLALVARDGDPAPGFPPGTVFGPNELPSEDYIANGSVVLINAAGRTAFNSKVAGPGIGLRNDDVAWSEGFGVLAPLAEEGAPTPGVGGGATFGFGPSVAGVGGVLNVATLNDSGQSALTGWFSGAPGLTEFEAGLWTNTSGAVELLASTATPVPGEPPGTAFDPLGFLNVRMNASGETVFTSSVVGPGMNDPGFEGIWSDIGGSLAAIIRSGEAAPGLPAGVEFAGAIGSFDINGSGNIVFSGEVTGPGIVRSENGTAVWSGPPEGLQLVAQGGAPLTGLSPSETVGFFRNVQLNAKDEVAFRAGISEPGVCRFELCTGIWSEAFGGLQLVARTGQQAPGAEAGVQFGRLNVVPGTDPLLGSGIESFSFNTLGQVAFPSGLTGPGVDDSNDRGIWAQDRTGELRLIIREGDLLEIAPGDFRVVESFETLLFDSTGSGVATSFNDRGQVAFRAIFTDGSEGVFVSDLAAVPEPGALALCLPVLACMSGRGRR